MRVVALVPGGIGDQILFFPTLDDLKRNYPDAQIDVVVEPRSQGAYRVCKSATNVIRFDFQDRNSLTEWVDLIGNIREREYDVAISLGQSWFMGLLLWLTGVPTRIGYGNGSSIFFNNLVSRKTEQYKAATYHDLLQGMGINSPCPELKINLPKPDIDWAENEQKRLGVQESGYILIHDSSSQPTLPKENHHSYPARNWQQIIQEFQQRQPDLPVVVLAESESEPLVQQLFRTCPGIKTTSPSDIGKSAAIIAGANLLVCTDSTPMYLAVAVQTYTVALFGATEPLKLLPPSDRFIGFKSPTGQIADISPQLVMERIWGG